MNLLIDTHVALWLFNEHENLSASAREILMDESNTLYISIVTAWEIAIKHSLNKLTEFSGGVSLFMSQVYDNPIEIKNISPQHIEIVEKLPFIHKDPFDRLIIATAKAENLTIITADENIQKYDVKWKW
jgi:PIN domain nuclease of toxin-antitoxin system